MKGIYKIECKTTGIVYIGSTCVSFKKRWKKHKQRLRNQYHENSYLQNSWNKYGEENFIFECIEDLTDKPDDIIQEREQYWLSIYFEKGRKYCFNLSDHVCGGNTVKSEEARNKLSESVKNSYTKELRDKRRQFAIENNLIENAQKKCGTEEWKKAHLEGVRKLAKDEKWLAKIRENGKKRGVKVGNDKGEIFNSLSDAAKHYNIGRANIRACIKGKTKSCRNMKWFYIED